MIKTGIIGTGYWGKILQDKLKLVSNLKFTQNSKNYNPECFTEVDWIFIATPPNTHYHIAKDCIGKNVNVFIEKPFCSNLIQAEELQRLAKDNNLLLYVDNVFLSRSEISHLRVKDKIYSINFLWYKDGPFHDTLVNDLLYHDLYILIKLYKFANVTNINIIQNEKNKLMLSFIYDNIKISIDYDRSGLLEQKKIIVINEQTIFFDNKNQDPLLSLIKKCLVKKIDFDSNLTLNLQTTKLIESIKASL